MSNAKTCRDTLFKLPRKRYLWEAFAGWDAEKATEKLTSELSQWNLQAQTQKGHPTRKEAFIYGVRKQVSIIRSTRADEEWLFKIVPVTADPTTRFWSNLLGSKESSWRVYPDCVLLQVDASTKEHLLRLKEALAGLVRSSSVLPWEIRHPRFQVSPGLHWQNKAKWIRLLNETDSKV